MPPLLLTHQIVLLSSQEKNMPTTFCIFWGREEGHKDWGKEEGRIKLELPDWLWEQLNFLTAFSLVSQFSLSVVSDSLWPHESRHTRPPSPSPTPGVYSNSCPSSWWCHPAISSSVVPFSSCPQSLPASGSFPMSQLFASGGQSIGVSALMR